MINLMSPVEGFLASGSRRAAAELPPAIEESVIDELLDRLECRIETLVPNIVERVAPAVVDAAVTHLLDVVEEHARRAVTTAGPAALPQVAGVVQEIPTIVAEAMPELESATQKVLPEGVMPNELLAVLDMAIDDALRRRALP